MATMLPNAAGPVADIFRDTLGRNPDAAGLEFWRQAMASGTPIGQIQAEIATSPEAQRLQRQAVEQAPPTGLIGAEQALRAGLTGAVAGVEEGQRQAAQSVGQGQQFLQPFAQAGGQAMELQAALSGAQGAGAQQQAFSDFTASPGQQFLRDRGEQAVTRNAAALGGLGGGRVMQELQQQGIGLAQQDFGNQFARLGQLSQFGLQGAGQQAGLSGQLAGQQAQAGQTVGSFALGTGQQLAAGRTRAGEQIASAIGGTTSALSQLINQQGAGQADIIGATGSNLANILAGAGQQQAAGQTQLATLLANLATQQGSTIAGLPGIPGIQHQQGLIETLGKAAGGAGIAMMASDVRLKTNITPAGVSTGGHNLYTWEWSEEGKAIAGNAPGFGVIAQEVLEKDPSAVTRGDHGYLLVNYAGIS